MFFLFALFASVSPTNNDKSDFFVLLIFVISFSTEDAATSVLLFTSSIIWAEIFLEVLFTVNLNLLFVLDFFNLFLILNFFLIILLKKKVSMYYVKKEKRNK